MITHQTFEISAPLPTHWRPASCEEVECRAFMRGFKIELDASTDEGARALADIAAVYGKAWMTRIGPTMVRFTAPPGTPCFRRAQHRLPLERDPLFRLKDGAPGQYRRGMRSVIMNEGEWLDRFAEHQGSIADARQRG